MEKVAWKGRIRPGKLAAYEERHRRLPADMAETLERAGVCNYTIWVTGDEVFGCYDCRYGAEHAKKVQAESAAVARWNEEMEEIMELPIDPATGYQYVLKRVFSFGCEER